MPEILFSCLAAQYISDFCNFRGGPGDRKLYPHCDKILKIWNFFMNGQYNDLTLPWDREGGTLPPRKVS